MLRIRDMSLARRKVMELYAHKVRISRRAMRGYITLAKASISRTETPFYITPR